MTRPSNIDVTSSAPVCRVLFSDGARRSERLLLRACLAVNRILDAGGGWWERSDVSNPEQHADHDEVQRAAEIERCRGADRGRERSDEREPEGLLSAMLKIGAESRVLPNERRKRRLRLPGAAIDHDFAAPVQPKIGPGTRKIRKIPASADVAQLVEHFTRNEGVPGSSPGVGSGRKVLLESMFWPSAFAARTSQILVGGYTRGTRVFRGALRRLVATLRSDRDSAPANSSVATGVAVRSLTRSGPARPRGPP